MLFLHAVLSAVVVRYFPLVSGLDGCWAYGLNLIAQTSYRFGRDVAFTYGPWSWMILPMNVGSNLFWGIAFQLAVWVVFAAALALAVFVQRVPLSGVALFVAGLLAGLPSFQSFGFAGFDVYIAFTALLLLGVSRTGRLWWVTFSAAVALGAVLALVKFTAASMVFGAAGVMALATLCFDKRRAVLSLGLTLCGPLLAALFFLAYYPSPTALVTYARMASQVAAGYSTAMSLATGMGHIEYAVAILACYGAGVVLLAVRRHTLFPYASALLLPLCVSFKHSFVREPGHSMMFFAFAPLVFGLLFLFHGVPRGRGWIAISPVVAAIVVLCAWPLAPVLVRWLPDHAFGLSMSAHLGDPFRTAQVGRAIDDASRPVVAESKLPASVVEAIGGEPVAIMPWNMNYVSAQPLRLMPLPVMMTYQYYTAPLDNWVAEWLRDDARAPRRILFEWIPMDDRHPLADAPAAALEMLRRYEEAACDGGRLVLRRNARPRFGALRALREDRMVVGERYPVPATEQPLAARIFAQWNASGVLRNAVLGIPPVEFVITTAGGRNATFRAIPATLVNGLPLNFLPNDLDQMRALLNGGAVDPITSITVAGPGARYLQPEIRIELCTVDGLRLAPYAPAPLTRDRGTQTSLVVESINGVEVGGRNDVIQVRDTDGVLRLNGWAFNSVLTEGASGVQVLLDGKPTFAEFGTPRPDIAMLHKCPDCANAGFRWVYPARQLGRETHTLTFRILHKDRQSFYEATKQVRFRIE